MANVFECADCGKKFTIEDLHFMYPPGYRLCNKCFKKFKSIPVKERALKEGLEDLVRIK